MYECNQNFILLLNIALSNYHIQGYLFTFQQALRHLFKAFASYMTHYSLLKTNCLLLIVLSFFDHILRKWNDLLGHQVLPVKFITPILFKLDIINVVIGQLKGDWLLEKFAISNFLMTLLSIMNDSASSWSWKSMSV